MTDRIHLLCLVAFCLVPGVLNAETRVRSGEHGNFTRLVFYLPDAVQGWSANRLEEGYEIEMDPAPAALDTSEVFAFIPRTRVRDVDLRNGAVWIESDCDCHVSIFQARPNVIAVDLRDGPDPASAPDAVSTRRQNRSSISNVRSLLGTNERTDWSVPSLVAFVPDTDTQPEIDPDALAVAVARAASNDLLRPYKQGTGLKGEGIETRSALDRAETDRTRRVQSALCQSLSSLNDLSTLPPAIAWQTLAAEHKTPEEQRARAMAYLALGFGAEAADAFVQSDLRADAALLLARIAQFIDFPIQSASSSFEAVVDCGGVPGLIAMLAMTDHSDVTEERSRDFVTTLSRLPAPLRAHLAPHVEAQLDAAGFAELARSARFTHQRVEGGAVALNRDSTVQNENSADPAIQANPIELPDTPYFQQNATGAVLDVISAGRFGQEDRILIEAWIQEAPSLAEADVATRVYVAALNRAGRSLQALSHLDARIGRRGALRSQIEAALSETLDAAMHHLAPGELILVEARLAERPWYKRLSESTRNSFSDRVTTVRAKFLASGDAPAGTVSSAEAMPDRSVANTEDNTAADTVNSPRRRAAEAAIAAAEESIASSARLRADAASRADAWLSGKRPVPTAAAGP